MKTWINVATPVVAMMVLLAWSAFRPRVSAVNRQVDETVSDPRPAQTSPDDFVEIPAGHFQMGSPRSEKGRYDDESPVHNVAIPGFTRSKYDVTRGEFAAFAKATGYDAGNSCYTFETNDWVKHKGRSWRDPAFPQTNWDPVVCVNWNDIHAYAEWFGRKTGHQYRLPTESEWEYAVRAGTTSARFWGDDPDQACTYANVSDLTAQDQIVDAKTWGIHNCRDGYAYNSPVGNFKRTPLAFMTCSAMFGNGRRTAITQTTRARQPTDRLGQQAIAICMLAAAGLGSSNRRTFVRPVASGTSRGVDSAALAFVSSGSISPLAVRHSRSERLCNA